MNPMRPEREGGSSTPPDLIPVTSPTSRWPHEAGCFHTVWTVYLIQLYVPKTLLFGTNPNHPDFRCHKPRSNPKWLLNVFAATRVSGFGLISVHFGCAFDILCSLSRNMPKMHTRIACSSVHRRCHYGYTLNDVNGPWSMSQH
jgi:hypothetical protein